MKTILFVVILLFGLVKANGQTTSDSLLQTFDKYWEVSPGIYRVMKNGLVGIASHHQLIVPCEYQQIWNLEENGYYRVLKNGKTGLFHLQRGIVIPAEYDQIWDLNDQHLMRVMKNGKIGYFNEQGNIVVPCEYQQVWDFHQGKARVHRDGKIGYVNSLGEEIIPCIYQQVWDFKNGMARVLKNGKVGYINESGSEIIPCDYQQIWDFHSDTARVLKDGKIGYIHLSGQTVIAPIFTQIWDFEGDTAKAILNNQIVYIDKKGSVLSTANQPILPEWEPNPSQNKSHIKDTLLINKTKEKRIEWKDEDNVTTLNIRVGEQEKRAKKKKSFKGHLWGVDLAFNQLMSPSGSLTIPSEYGYLDLNGSKSIATTVHFLQEDIGLNPSGSLGIVTSFGIDFNNYRFDSQNILIKNEEGLIDYLVTDRLVEKNKLTAVYLNVPVLLEFQIKPNRQNDPLYISGGVVGGVRLKSYTKVVYNDEKGRDKEKNKGNYNLQDLRYGLTARVGYKFINLTGTYYISPLFEKNGDPELNPLLIGISLYPDWF